ncbi:MAG: ABC transporter permease [Thermodesulfovibrionales bacterium]|nr:ABC transporter permease [Nitrospirota bacterium]MCG2710549.1 ABC transporter permease [Thermodesulfovibrionales bacterium]MCG2814190.1 ABC transporter permease [Thermodesulfovibrionales bacterium]
MHLTGKIAGSALIIILILAVFSSVLSPYDPEKIDLDTIKEPPGIKHPFGTDNKGRDILSRVLYGGRISVSIAVIAAFISMFIGLVMGLCSGYLGGKADTAIMAVVDLILAFPSLLLAIGVSIIFPAGVYTVMIAIAFVGWASFARLIRGHVLTLKDAAYIEAAEAIGCSRFRILFVHLMPQCLPIGLVMAGIKLGGYVLTEASLSFLGLGAQPPMPTWGSMVSMNRAYIVSEPWMVLFPGMAIAVTALCFNVLGDALRDKYGLKVKM